MSAFSFNTTYQPTGDQQKDAIAQIDIIQNRAVQANFAYQSAYYREGDRLVTSMEIGSCHFHRTVFKLPSLISFGQRRLYFPH